MPNYFMPAKDPSEVRQFFQEMVDQGKLKVVLATERPDVYDRITPTEEIRLVVDRADATPPENVDFDKVLGEFRPTPLPQDQVASWSDEISPESGAPEAGASEDEPLVVEGHPSEDIKPEEEDAIVAGQPPAGSDGAGSALDRKWIPFADRGFKG